MDVASVAFALLDRTENSGAEQTLQAVPLRVAYQNPLWGKPVMAARAGDLKSDSQGVLQHDQLSPTPRDRPLVQVYLASQQSCLALSA